MKLLKRNQATKEMQFIFNLDQRKSLNLGTEEEPVKTPRTTETNPRIDDSVVAVQNLVAAGVFPALFSEGPRPSGDGYRRIYSE